MVFELDKLSHKGFAFILVLSHFVVVVVVVNITWAYQK